MNLTKFELINDFIEFCKGLKAENGLNGKIYKLRKDRKITHCQFQMLSPWHHESYKYYQKARMKSVENNITLYEQLKKLSKSRILRLYASLLQHEEAVEETLRMMGLV